MVTICEVLPRSRAARRGVRAGDILVAINSHPIADVLDYRFYLAEETVVLTLLRGKREIKKKLRKEIYDDIGLVFATPLMDKKQTCRNGCVFCFIDQLPKGMREPLYFKDDDARLSFLHGNYITLTNLTDADIDRIIAMHIAPIHISVHTTNPALRVQMMRNKRAGEVLSYLGRLAEAGITMRAQIVLCRGLNDGEELVRSLRDLAAYAPALDSVSIVPAGLTAHREGLYPLTPFTREEARAVIETVEKAAHAAEARYGTRLFYAADELYLLAELPLPPEEAYDGYPQIENGVGMLRSFYEEAALYLESVPQLARRARCVSVATGAAAFGMIREISEKVAKKHGNLTSKVYEIKNTTFGESITVAGLLTGKDILAQLTGRELGELLLLPRSVLRAEGDLFLCGTSPQELETALGVDVRFVGEDGAELCRLLLGDD